MKSPRRKPLRRKLAIEPLEDRRVLATTGTAVAGDSLSDEYAGTAYSYAQSWVELLAQNQGFNFGPQGSWGAPRGTGYEYNWASNGSLSSDLQTQGQVSGITNQIAAGQVGQAVVASGENDFAPTSAAYAAIYNGQWTSNQIASYTANVASNVVNAAQTLELAGADVLLADIPDTGITPAAIQAFPNAAKRALVSAAIEQTNLQIEAQANSDHLAVVDLFGLFNTVLGTAQAPNATVTIGGVTYTNAAGEASSNTFVADGYHPQTVVQALMANVFEEGFDRMFGDSYSLFSEAEIDSLTGKTGTGANSLNLNDSQYVILPHVTVFVDFGDGTSADDFTSRLDTLATESGIAQFTTTEVQSFETAIVAGLETAFTGFQVQVVTTAPQYDQYITLDYGTAGATITAAPSGSLAYSLQNWLFQQTDPIAYVFPDEFTSTSNSQMSRSDFTGVLSQALTYFGIQDIGFAFGLNHQDAYGDDSITPATYANTGTIPLRDYMYYDATAGFEPSYFEANIPFGFSRLSRTKLNFITQINTDAVDTVSETTSAHGTIATAQALTLTNLSSQSLPGVNAADVNFASLAPVTQTDMYSVTANQGDLLTANTVSSNVYSSPGTFDSILTLLDAKGDVLATSNGIYLGPDSFGPGPNATQLSTDSFILNYVIPANGVYYLQVTGSGTASSYDLFVAKTNANANPWYNQDNPMDVNNDGFISPLDVLLIINELNTHTVSNSQGQLPVPIPSSVTTVYYYDVNDDGYVSPLDALLIINYLNSTTASANAAVSEATPGISAATVLQTAPPQAAAAVAASTGATPANVVSGPTNVKADPFDKAESSASLVPSSVTQGPAIVGASKSMLTDLDDDSLEFERDLPDPDDLDSVLNRSQAFMPLSPFAPRKA